MGNIYSDDGGGSKFGGPKQVTLKNAGIYSWSDGRLYEGEFSLEGRTIHGLGRLTWPNGDVYEGEFQNGAIEGRGKLTYENGREYHGDFKEGRSHGMGVMKFPSGDVYAGEFCNGRRTGQGISRTVLDGSEYEGRFEDGQPHGWGQLSTADGSEFTGEFFRGAKKGRGTLRTNDGTVYVGSFTSSGALTGRARIEFSSGDTIQGTFLNSKAHGWCQYFSVNGDKFEGNFANNLQHGDGIFSSKDGRNYIGQYEYGQAHGHGVHHRVDGSYYGTLMDGKANGWGVFESKAGDVYEGAFKNEKYHGKGVFTWRDGRKNMGQFRNGQFEELVDTTEDVDIAREAARFAQDRAQVIRTTNYNEKKLLQFAQEVLKASQERKADFSLFENSTGKSANTRLKFKKTSEHTLKELDSKTVDVSKRGPSIHRFRAILAKSKAYAAKIIPKKDPVPEDTNKSEDATGPKKEPEVDAGMNGAAGKITAMSKILMAFRRKKKSKSAVQLPTSESMSAVLRAGLGNLDTPSKDNPEDNPTTTSAVAAPQSAKVAPQTPTTPMTPHTDLRVEDDDTASVAPSSIAAGKMHLTERFKAAGSAMRHPVKNLRGAAKLLMSTRNKLGKERATNLETLHAQRRARWRQNISMRSSGTMPASAEL